MSIQTSKEAANTFKEKIRESLHLLGFLDHDDKLDVWKFWKTVSAALKIAVNGKGDFSKRDKITRRYATTDTFLQSLDQQAITIFIPEAHGQSLSFRVMTFMNNKKISEKLENANIQVNDVENNCQTLSENNLVLKQENILDLTFNENVSSWSESNFEIIDNVEISTQSPRNLHKKVPKTWPVSRPSTRLSSKISNSNTQEQKQAQELFKTLHSECDSIESAPYTEINSKVLSKVIPKTEIISNAVKTIPIECEKSDSFQSFSQTMNEIEITTPNYENIETQSCDVNTADNLAVNQNLESSIFELESNDLIDTVKATEKTTNFDKSSDECSTQIKTESDQIHNRTSSDIETIISALEEELKKSNSCVDIAAIESKAEEMTVISESSLVEGHGELSDIPKDQIIEIAEVQNVVWTSDDILHVIPQTDVSYDEPEQQVALDVNFDVVECEVEAEQTHHMRQKIPKDDTQYDVSDRTCPQCNRVLQYATSMKAHMRIHTGDKPFPCSQCQRKFTTKANRDRHEATHVGLKPFACEHCNKCFTEKRSMKVHMRTHTGERPFVCTFCGKGFTQKCSLLVHMDTHTKKKGHLCDLCGKAFQQKNQLDVHILRHNRQARFPCPECQTKCYTKGDLVRHMVRHTGERPYQCKLCPRSFTRRQYLIDHENMHYGRQPYKCSFCFKSFHDLGACYKHIRKHKEEEAQKTKNGEDCKVSVMTNDDLSLLLDANQPGQIFTMTDGSRATLKAVSSSVDGSTVYHITKLPDDICQEGKDNFESTHKAEVQ